MEYVSKPSSACYAVRAVVQIENLKVVNFVVKSKAFMLTKFIETVLGQQVPLVVMQ